MSLYHIITTFFIETRDSLRSVSVVSTVMRRPTPFRLEDTMTDVAIGRRIRRVLVLGRDVPQKSVLRRKRNTALFAVRRRRMDASTQN